MWLFHDGSVRPADERSIRGQDRFTAPATAAAATTTTTATTTLRRGTFVTNTKPIRNEKSWEKIRKRNIKKKKKRNEGDVYVSPGPVTMDMVSQEQVYLRKMSFVDHIVSECNEVSQRCYKV